MKFPDVGVLGSIAAAALVVGGLIVYSGYRRRLDPEVLRCRRIDNGGRIIEGMLTDVHDRVVYYQWEWRGVEYEASQDLRRFGDRLPETEDALIGPVTVKFLSNDPANSIVMSEQWNGLRVRKPSTGVEPAK
jgi:hypothetical protein